MRGTKRRVVCALGLCLLMGGCAAEVEPTATPEPTPTAVAEVTPEPTPVVPTEIYTDWSKLEPYEAPTPVYTRRYEERTENLIPADDYGPLIPFAGAMLSGTEEYDLYPQEYPLYGLVTTKGEVVVDPVYNSAEYMKVWDSWGNVTSDLGVLMLGKTCYDEEGSPEERLAFCAVDGSWCTDFLYQYNWDMYGPVKTAAYERGIPAMDMQGRLEFLDPDTGEIIRTLDLAAQTGSSNVGINGLWIDRETGWVSVNCDDASGDRSRVLLFDPQGRPKALPAETLRVDRYGDGLVLAQKPGYRYGYVDASSGEWAIEPIFKNAQPFINGVAPVNDGQRIYFINTAGEALTEDLETMPEYEDGYWWKGSTAIFDKDLAAVTNRPDERKDFPADAPDDGVLEDGVRLTREENCTTLLDREGNIIFCWPIFASVD